jgi:carbon monoxide dehydrogenase subunit G
VSKIAGVSTELTYRLAEQSADHLVFVGKNKSATSTDTISVRPVASGTEVTYNANIEMHGLAKLASPAIKIVFEKIGNDTKRQMTSVLNALAA